VQAGSMGMEQAELQGAARKQVKVPGESPEGLVLLKGHGSVVSHLGFGGSQCQGNGLPHAGVNSNRHEQHHTAKV